ncbi:MAG: hypothetical protein AUJ02_04210 [Chloroflexi bacterium 13_1_40CM_3_65_12]|nr:MAG: hypothetical protein AUJ02_04210 [Chloroflexi bacterium 13_1_40CM_3_65_12]
MVSAKVVINKGDYYDFTPGISSVRPYFLISGAASSGMKIVSDRPLVVPQRLGRDEAPLVVQPKMLVGGLDRRRSVWLRLR